MPTTEKISRSIVLISSQDPENTGFGTGFIIGQGSSDAYVLTCAHVIRDVGGADQVAIDDFPTTVIASGDSDSLDLAVLRVDGLWDKTPLEIEVGGEKGSQFEAVGFRPFDRERLVRTIHGTLGEQVGLQYRKTGERVPVWDLHIDLQDTIERGYSGSPVINPETGRVLGVISHREGAKKGLAICISSLSKIWQVLDSDQLFRILLTLGYHKQDRLFRQLPLNRAVTAAFLIHGSPEYCPRWLLNRLIVRHVSSRLTTRKIVKTRLTRRSRSISVEALWRELGGRVGASRGSPAVIAERVVQWWKTQDVILIIHDIHVLPEAELHNLIREFWSVLLEKAGNLSEQEHSHMLLMFLIDYEDNAGETQAPFIEQIDANWQPHSPVRFQDLSNFSKEDLLSWVDFEFDNLPEGLRNLSEDTVQELLALSEDGVPELALEVLCLRCGCNWYEESDKWLKQVS